MFDLDTLAVLNQQACDRSLRENKRALRASATSLQLANALDAGLTIDLAVGKFADVMVVCERMMDTAFRCAPIAIEALVKDLRRTHQ